MEKKSNFDMNHFAEMMLQYFTSSYLHTGDVLDIYTRLRDKTNSDIEKYSSMEDYKEKRLALEKCRKILERCRDFFKDPSLKKEVDSQIQLLRTQLGTEPHSSLIAKTLLRTLSEEFWGEDKRKYDMSDIATKDTIPTTTTSQGKIVKAVKYMSFEDRIKEFEDIYTDKDKPQPPKIDCIDRRGNTISIEYMGTLYYNDGVVPNEYINKYLITRNINGVTSKEEVFSELSIGELKDNPELCDIVITELLSKNNITKSNAEGYIGNITTSENPHLEIGTENEGYGFYRYQIDKKHLLEYNGQVIEAIKAYKEKQLQKHSEAVKDEKSEEPEL